MRKLLIWIILLPWLLSLTPKSLTWVAIGDSITYLNDHPNETGNRVQKGYLTRVKEKLPHISYINQGHNGWTAARIADQLDKLNLTNADIYTVFLGTNDWWSGRPLGAWADYQNATGSKTFYGSLRLISDKLKSLNPNAKVIWLTPLQRGDFVYLTNFKNNAYGSYKPKNEQQLEQFANAVVAVARHEQMDVIDLYHDSGITPKNAVKFKRLKNPNTGLYEHYKYPAYLNVAFNPDVDEYPYPVESIKMTYDGLHPSDRGNAIIAKMLIKNLRRL